MDPVTIAVTAGAAAGGYLLRLGYRWIKARAEVRRAELEQQGLSERIRCLPTGSRLTEKSADREVDITVGGIHPAAGNQER
ncbi:hypothetical protein SAMN04487981_12960 [Streptomyces sp. cf386]|uniref:hypothetical protein n=1 Tax=Streptomyces sp. cf386 TaxID=1761904 RepID=UPI00088AC823|nr:hypothetical protein [Streptomyces sp. cf386]SDP62541.1 hypothetical protein SAMN04487981_12960 [Streptomyces sp. cf386]